MVLISHKYKFIYIKNKKVASTSVEAFFQKFCLPEEEQKNYVPTNETVYRETPAGIIGARHKADHKFYNHISAKEVKKLIGAKKFNSYYKFSVVRNPFDSVVSYYFWQEQNDKMPFSKYCKKDRLKNLKRISIDGNPVMDYIIRFENLEQGIKHVCEKVGIPFDPSLIAHFKSGYRQDGNDYHKMYTENDVKSVQKAFKKEINYFNYKF